MKKPILRNFNPLFTENDFSRLLKVHTNLFVNLNNHVNVKSVTNGYVT